MITDSIFQSIQSILPAPVVVTEMANLIPQGLRSRYGRGLAYPATLSDNMWDTQDAEYKIKTAVFILLSTPLGTRLFLPEFGSMIPYMVFQSVTRQFESELKNHVESAISRWEPRIVLEDVIITTAADSLGVERKHTVVVNIYYKIKGTNSISDLSLPISLDDSGIKFQNSGAYTVGGRIIYGAGVV